MRKYRYILSLFLCCLMGCGADNVLRENRVAAQTSEARKLIEAKDYEGAIAIIEKLTERKENTGSYFALKYTLALAYGAKGDEQKKLAILSELLAEIESVPNGRQTFAGIYELAMRHSKRD
jgi:tetratricopeptide (TPR) repeat protein